MVTLQDNKATTILNMSNDVYSYLLSVRNMPDNTVVYLRGFESNLSKSTPNTLANTCQQRDDMIQSSHSKDSGC